MVYSSGRHDTQHDDIQRYDIQHNNKTKVTLSETILSAWCHYAGHCYAECAILSVMSFIVMLSIQALLAPRNTKGGSITLPLTSCLTGFELAV
jgi:hypothetical protein